MKYGINDALIIEKWAPSMNGVFTLSDLKNLLNEKTSVIFYRRVRLMIKSAILRQFIRGIFVTKNYSKEILAMRINEKSYISLGSSLSKSLVIGSIPDKKIYTIKTGRNRVYSDGMFTVAAFGISSHLYFGFKTENEINIATPEKAFLDTLFFYTKGYKFSFDIFSDIDTTTLNRKLINEYLKKYRNSRFQTFVKGYLHERS
ncbi:MAG: hypothetical protein JNL74_07570 [Fibrobacteres bacterium]|nr:hypothetical protein [Fibrobacterota bacterium]